MNSDEQTALLKEIRDTLVSDNEQAKRYRDAIESLSEELDKARNGYFERIRAATQTWFRIQIAFAVINIVLLWLILTAVTK